MARKKTYEPLGSDGAMYGWTGMSPKEFAHRMSLASDRFLALKKELKFDAIAFCGSSGCAIAFNLAALHEIPLIYVRKKDEKSHSRARIECNDKLVEVKKYLIVDDFVDQGSTIDHIVSTIESQALQACAYPAKPVGVLCFDPYVYRDQTMDTEVVSLKLFSVEK
jgi:adenine/guanine phosphoribosyltransferase-like PRPP-binding protein